MSENPHNTGLDLSRLPSDLITPRIAAPGDQAAGTCTLNRYVTLVGGRQDCHLHISHLDVSKVHCAFVQTGSAIVVVDLCSRFGTFVNDRRIKVATIQPGDTLRVGPTDVTITWPALGSRPTRPAGGACPISLRTDAHQYKLGELPAVLGRRSSCHVQLDTPDVSLAHALIFAFRGRPAIYDLGSRSGTIVNGERVASAWLVDGDALTIGGERLYVACSTSRAGAGAADPNADTAAGLPVESGEADKLVRLVQSGIASLSERVAARRDKIKQREHDIDSRVASIKAMRDEAEARRRENEQHEAKLAQREQTVRAAEDRFERRRQSLAKAQTKLRTAAGELQAERKRLGEEASRLADEATRLAAERETLAGERQASGKLRAALEKQQAAAAAQQQRITELEQQLADAHQEIEQQQLREQQMAEKMQTFHRALQEVSQAFGEEEPDENELRDGGEAGGSSNEANDRPRSNGDAQRRLNGDAERRSNGDAQRLSNTDAQPEGPSAESGNGRALPGPIVDEPMFVSVHSGDETEAPEQPPKSKRRRWWS